MVDFCMLEVDGSENEACNSCRARLKQHAREVLCGCWEMRTEKKEKERKGDGLVVKGGKSGGREAGARIEAMTFTKARAKHGNETRSRQGGVALQGANVHAFVGGNCGVMWLG